MKELGFPYEYVGGGYFRLKSVPRGKPAPLLHGNEVVTAVFEWAETAVKNGNDPGKIGP